MSLVEIVCMALGVSMDALAVAFVCSVSLGDVSPRQFFRLSFHFGLFQALMPVLGWLAGRSVHAWIQSWDHWLVFAILVFLGTKSAYASFTCEETGDLATLGDPTRGVKLMALSLATSLDAMAVGLSLAMLQVSPVVPVIIIGAITGCLTLVGMKLGARLDGRLGPKLQAAGGLVLIGLGIKILGEHLIV